MSIIKLITHPEPYQTWQARVDEAKITNQPFVERPYWFENTDTGQLYHDLYGCIGYPTEVAENDHGQAGYVAIVGVVRPSENIEHYNPLNADFQLLEEAESRDIQGLLTSVIELRAKYGFGIQPHLLTSFFGDPDRFITTLSLRNEQLRRKSGDHSAILISPPVDFYDTKVFDNYIRSLKSCMTQNNKRFFFGGNDILKNNLREFQRDCPAVMAIGGLVHTLLTACTWMSKVGNNVFVVEE